MKRLRFFLARRIALAAGAAAVLILRIARRTALGRFHRSGDRRELFVMRRLEGKIGRVHRASQKVRNASYRP